MNPNMYEDGKEMMELCLVGMVFGNKIVNREGLSDEAEQVWRTSRKIRVELMGVTNIFMFHFGCKADRQRGELIGSVMDTDTEGPTRWAQVIIDVTKPLCRGLRVFTDNDSDAVSNMNTYRKEEGLVSSTGRPRVNRYGDWLKAFNLKQWRKERRERKGKSQWSDSNTSSGKSSDNGDDNWFEGFDTIEATMNSEEEVGRLAVMKAREA
ncbi:hypothetical protein TorRG33x02_336490 [Trema orientale]|uniref:DUF4283 domain-containing protein n=1 Tax=Trema orientale TaxID=63057 RepID=A0A2P5B022_TREOI|nr:hypothetical protein TorRG33x02_336490 [Trema orientale]